MKKEELIALGVTDEAVAEKVAAAIADAMKGYVPKARFDEVNAEKKAALDQAKEHKAQLDQLKETAGDNAGLKTQIERLQADNAAKDAAHAAELKQLRIDNAVDAALTSANALNKKAARALLNLENAELLEDGSVKGLADQIKALTGAEDSKFLFASQQNRFKGARVGQSGLEGPEGREDVKNMSYDQLCAYLEANPDAQLR